MLLKDKVIVVSGIGPGLGQSIAIQCARAGADLVLAARTQSKLDEVAELVEKEGRRAIGVPTDITDDAAVEHLAAAAVEAFGRVDGLVSNAFAMPSMRDLTKVELDPLHESFRTNVLAVIRLARYFKPALIESKGSIVVINSAVIRHSRRTFAAYKVNKAALMAATQGLATELGPHGVRVNSVVPSYIWADTLKMYFEYLGQQRGIPAQQVYDEIAATTDLRRLPEPDEIADAVVFLSSPMARAITGHSLDVNAGEFHR